MNKKLKKYIKKNLKEKKSIHFIPLLFDKFFSKEESIEYLEESSAPKITPKLRIDSNAECDEDFTELNIEKDVIPFLKKNGIDIEKEYDLPEFLIDNEKYNNFQKTLFKMIDDRNLKDSDVYNKVHLDRRLFSKIRNDKSYHPSKETVILIGLSLMLNEDEIEELLDSASYSLPRNNEYDLIIRFCFMKGIYDISKINEFLNEYNLNELNY